MSHTNSLKFLCLGAQSNLDSTDKSSLAANLIFFLRKMLPDKGLFAS